jgi:hypothetical protein
MPIRDQQRLLGALSAGTAVDVLLDRFRDRGTLEGVDLSVQQTLSPRRRAWFVDQGSVEQLRRALQGAASIWGGMRCPILPVDAEGQTTGQVPHVWVGTIVRPPTHEKDAILSNQRAYDDLVHIPTQAQTTDTRTSRSRHGRRAQRWARTPPTGCPPRWSARAR